MILEGKAFNVLESRSERSDPSHFEGSANHQQLVKQTNQCESVCEAQIQFLGKTDNCKGKNISFKNHGAADLTIDTH